MTISIAGTSAASSAGSTSANSLTSSTCASRVNISIVEASASAAYTAVAARRRTVIFEGTSIRVSGATGDS